MLFRSLDPRLCLPAIGQGALGIEGRSNDQYVRSILNRLTHQPTQIAVAAERALLHRLEGGCQVPIAAYATLTQNEVQLEGLVASVDGKTVIRDVVRGTSAEAQVLGTQLAERLLSRGADKILHEIYGKA